MCLYIALLSACLVLTLVCAAALMNRDSRAYSEAIAVHSGTRDCNRARDSRREKQGARGRTLTGEMRWMNVHLS